MSIYDVLELVKIKIESLDPVPEQYLVSRGNVNGFEELVPLIVSEIIAEMGTDSKLEMVVHYGKNFPDMDLIIDGIRFGIELKSRNNGSWDVPGNSVFESVSDQEYEEIFLLFGSHKKGIPRMKVRYKHYWEVTSGISVTHSPRFKVNMNADESVFKSSADYKKLQSMEDEDKILFLQDYLKNNTSGLKWFVPAAPDTVKPLHLNALSDTVKNQVICETLILYPQDLLRPKGNSYTRTIEYLIVTHFYYSHSLRDFFSAGGQWDVNGVKFPQTVKRLHDNREIILDMIKNSNSDWRELAYQSWETAGFYFSDEPFEDCYFTVLNQLGEMFFPELLKDSKIDKLSNFLLNYTTSN